MKNLFVLSFAVVGVVSHAQVIFESDFNSPAFSLGTVDGQGGWSAPLNVIDVSTEGRNATQGMDFLMPAPGVFSNATNNMSAGFSGVLSGSVDIKVNADYVPSGASRNLRTGMTFVIGDTNTSSEVSYYMDTVTNGNNQRFDVLSFYIDSNLIDQKVIDFDRGDWITLSVDYNPATGLTKFFYNGGFQAEDTAMVGANLLTSVSGQLSNGDTSLVSGVRVQHDNYRFEAVPEPATMAVLAGLGALALRRRKK